MMITPIWGPKQFQEAIHEELVEITISIENVEIETTSQVTHQLPDEGSPKVRVLLKYKYRNRN